MQTQPQLPRYWFEATVYRTLELIGEPGFGAQVLVRVTVKAAMK